MSAPASQPTAWAVIRSEFSEALAAERVAWVRDENQIGGARSPELDRFVAAYDALMECPAPDIEGLAFKIASHRDAPDFADFDPTLPEAASWLAIYRDALALSIASAGHAALRHKMREVEELASNLNSPDAAPDALERWSERREALLEQVEALPNTPANARIKAEAIAHIYHGEEPLCDDDSTDSRLARQVVQCLIGGDV